MGWNEKERSHQLVEETKYVLQWRKNRTSKKKVAQQTKLKYKNNRCNGWQFHLQNGFSQDICLTSQVPCGFDALCFITIYQTEQHTELVARIHLKKGQKIVEQMEKSY